MSNSIRSLLNNCLRIAQATVTQPCVLCGGRVRGRLICPACEADLPILPRQRCPSCAHPSPGGLICGACLKHPPRFDHAQAVYGYGFPLDVLIQRCKYHGAQELTAFFADALAQHLEHTCLPECIVPMPLHPARLRERGFNQAMEIARRLGTRLNLPVLHACQRLRNTPPQTGLDLKARKRNLLGAFACDLSLQGKHIALLDDVLTSGSSLNELARAARHAGARQIDAWVVARTVN